MTTARWFNVAGFRKHTGATASQAKSVAEDFVNGETTRAAFCGEWHRPGELGFTSDLHVQDFLYYHKFPGAELVEVVGKYQA